MTPELIFLVANNGILMGWLLLAALPQWKGTQFVVHSMLVPIVLGLTYSYFIYVGTLGAPPEGASFFTLDGVMKFFTLKEAALAGWVHYLVFDLFIGAWQVRDARRRGLNHLAVLPCLVFTLMVGPVGLLLYLVVRAAAGKGGWTLNET